MGRSEKYRRYAKQCLEMANAIQDPKGRAALLQMAQVCHDEEEKSDQLPRLRALRIRFLGDFLPGLRHVLQKFAVFRAFGLAGHAAAFLRKPQVLRYWFHVGKNGASALPFPNS